MTRHVILTVMRWRPPILASMLRRGHGLMMLVLTLLVLGVVMVNSARLSIGGENTTLTSMLLGRTTILAAMALACMILASFIPVSRLFTLRGLASPVPWLVLACLVLLILVRVPGIGHQVNGAWRWIRVGSVQFQASEIAKWSLPLILAWHCARRAGSMGRLMTGFMPPMVLILTICAMIAIEDLGTAALIGMASVLMLLAAGARVRHVLLMVPVGLAGFIAALVHSPYRIDRLRAFLNPYADPQGIGYHIIQSMGATHTGELAGRGLGNSIRKFDYLPEDTTDFILAIICEELGVVGASLVCCLFGALLVITASIIRRTRHPFARLFGTGILFTIGLQALINMMVVTGLAPTKGIALPLISAGGTGWLLTAFSLGLVASIDRENEHYVETDHTAEPVLELYRPHPRLVRAT